MLIALDECRNALEEAVRKLETQAASGPMAALASSVRRLETEAQTLRQDLTTLAQQGYQRRIWWVVGSASVASLLVGGLVVALWVASTTPSDAVLWRVAWHAVKAVQQQQQPPPPPAPLARKPR